MKKCWYMSLVTNQKGNNMSMSFCVTHEELKKALKLINEAIKNGYKDSLAVLQIYGTGGGSLGDFIGRSTGVVLKAHPTNPNKNFGYTNHPEWEKYINGKSISYAQRD